MSLDDPQRRARDEERGVLFRFAGLSMEFAGGIVGFVLLGYWLDARFATGRTLTIIGAILGCVGGLYYVVKQAVAIQRERERKFHRNAKRDDDHSSA